jgi:phosphonate transport system substrate-binding protein
LTVCILKTVRQAPCQRLLLPVFLLLLGLSFSSCREAEKPIKISLEKRQEITFRPQVPALTYAYLPQYSNTESFQRHHRLVEYLSKASGIPLRQVFPDSFNDHINMFGQGKIDISFANPFIYVKLANRYGARAMTRIIESTGKAEFRGQIIARKDNEQIRSTADCREKSWVAVDPSSAGGYLFPLGHFIDNGISLQDFQEVVFAGGRQENVILGVYAGLYDIGSIREGSLAVVQDKIDIDHIKVVDNSRWYPGWVYAYSPRLPGDVVEKIRQAMLQLDYQGNSEHRQILDAAKFIGFIASDDHDFDPIRELSKKVGLDID